MLNDKQVFLVDAIGAFITTILLFGILMPLDHYFGMPKRALYILSGIAFCFFIYSISCHLFIQSNWKPFLGAIIIGNISYSIISIGLIYQNFDKLTGLGVIYFALELIIIGILVFVEFKTYRKIQ